MLRVDGLRHSAACLVGDMSKALGDLDRGTFDTVATDHILKDVSLTIHEMSKFQQRRNNMKLTLLCAADTDNRLCAHALFVSS